MSDRPNVILLMTDQWRGDCLSVENHPVVHTPFLDQLALDGCRFGNAYSATPTCIAARASLFTGLAQKNHGRVGYQDGVPWNYETTLAGEFTRHGYQTQAVGKMHVYPERSQLGFQNVMLHDGYLHFARLAQKNGDDDYLAWLRERLGPDADYYDHGLDCNSNVARPWDKEERFHPTNWVVTQGIDFLRRRDPRKPFFLFLSFHRPHPPYDPPQWAFDQYINAPMPDAPRGDWEQILDPYENSKVPNAQVADLPPHLLQRSRAGYYGHMSHIDMQIRRFIESLVDYRLHDNTVICFTSDHGEMLGDHRLFRKSLGYDGSALIPLLLNGPERLGIQKRLRNTDVVDLQDVMPTLLDCAGLPIPESLDGQSMLGLARGETTPLRETLHGEHTAFGGSQHWINDGRWKYLWWSQNGHEQLFDRETDPRELRDLARDPGAAEHLQRLRAELIRQLGDREEGFVQDGALVAGRPVTAVLSHIRE